MSSNQFLWINKNFTYYVMISEEPLNRKDDVKQDVRNTADDVKEGFDETGDK